METQAIGPVVGATGPTLAEAASAYLAAYPGRDTSRFQRISAWSRLLGDKPLSTVSPDDIDAALGTLATEASRVFAGKDADGHKVYRKKGAGQRSGATLNRYLVALGALYTWARRNRLVPRGFESPTRHIEKFPEARGRVRYLSNDERARLLKACQAAPWPRLYLLALMAMTTGARRGELLALRWKDVDLDRSEARIGEDAATATKNGDARSLVLLSQVADELAKFAPKDAATSEALVFRSRLRPSQPYAMEQVWRDAVEAAALHDFRFHDLRHTAASYMAQSGASLLEIADTLGHRQLRMVQRYAHLNTDSRRRLMARVFEGRI